MNFIIVLGSSNAETRRLRVGKAVEYYNHLIYENSKQIHTTRMGVNYFSAYDEEYTSCVHDKFRLVFSGKGNLGEGLTEAADMRRIAVLEFNVPENVCIIEAESQNTHENLVNALNVLQSFTWFKPTFHSIKPIFTICTSHFHAKRSLIIGMHVLSNYGYVNIIHTGEPITTEAAEREKNILDMYIKECILPKMSVNYM